MNVEGNLEAMSLPSLVQFTVQECDQAVIQLENGDDVGKLYVDNGQICHAELENSNLDSEEVVYSLLHWKKGAFKVQQEVEIPAVTIHKNWVFLLMEGLRRIDEASSSNKAPHLIEHPIEEEIALSLSASDAVAIQEIVQQEINDKMATKSEELQSILNGVVSSSSDIIGAVIVDNDGLLLASSLNNSQDGNRVAAVTAGLISLAGRSSQQLAQGEVNQTLIRAEKGNIVVLRAGTGAAFVALTPSSANLGMLFMECRDAAQAIAKSLN